MFREEARWLEERIMAREPEVVFPMVNLGSSTVDFVTHVQPWIDECLLAPMRRLGAEVINVDLKAAPGVDIVGDVRSESVRRQIIERHPRSVLCSNFLEHVEDPAMLASAVVTLIPVGGLLFVSGPRRYPYHADPIDNMLRPTVAELASLFPGATLLEGEALQCGRYRQYAAPTARRLGRMLLRPLVPVPLDRWRDALYRAAWLQRRISATCLVLERTT